MILFGNRVFTDVIKTRIKKDHPGLGMVLNPISMYSEEDRKGDLTHTEKAMGRQRQILEGCSHKLRNTQSWKRKEGSSLEPSESAHACVHAPMCSIVSNSLRPHGLQHTRLSHPSLFCLLELAQTHVHWVSDAIPPSYPLLSFSPPDLSLSQHQVFSLVKGNANQNHSEIPLHTY